MKLLVCLLLCAAPVLCDTLWVLTGAGTNWEDRTPVLDLIVPVGADGEATNVTSWSTHCDCFAYTEYGDISDYLAIYWPISPGIEVGPLAPYGPPQVLFARDESSDFQPSGMFFSLMRMDGLGTNELKATYGAGDYGDAPYGPYGPFTVTDPPAAPVPEPSSLALIGLAATAALLFRRRYAAMRS